MVDLEFYGKMTSRSFTYINLGDCDNLIDVNLLVRGHCCPLLKEINISSLMNIADNSIAVIASGCRDLVTISLLECIHISGIILQALGKECFFPM